MTTSPTAPPGRRFTIWSVVWLAVAGLIAAALWISWPRPFLPPHGASSWVRWGVVLLVLVALVWILWWGGGLILRLLAAFVVVVFLAPMLIIFAYAAVEGGGKAASCLTKDANHDGVADWLERNEAPTNCSDKDRKYYEDWVKEHLPGATTAPTTAPTTRPTTGPTSQPTAPSTTTAPTTAPPASTDTPAGPVCESVPVMVPRWVAVTLPQPAGSQASRDMLNSLRGSAVKIVIYQGALTGAESVNHWLDDTLCAGRLGAVSVDDAFNTLGTSRAQQYIKDIDAHADLQAYVININTVPEGRRVNPRVSVMVTELNQRIAAIQMVTAKPVWAFVNWSDPDQAKRLAYLRSIKADVHIVGYYPYKTGYGPEGRLDEVGAMTRTVDGANATAAVQGFTLSGLSSDLPSPDMVAQLGKHLTDHGTQNLVFVTQGPAADNPEYVGQSTARLDGLLN